MQALQITLSIFSMIAYLVCFGFVAYAVTRLQHTERRINNLESKITTILVLSIGEYVRRGTETLNHMMDDYNHAVEQEDYEAAGQLQALIKEQKHSLEKNVNEFNKAFGHVADIDIHQIVGKHDTQDDE